MDHHQVAPQTCVLKMNVKCGNCQRRVKKTLQKIHGVHSINIDANEGKVTLSTSVDPQILIEMLTEAGKAAQLLWVQKPQVNNQNHVEHPNIKNVPIAPGNAQSNGLDYHKLHITQLQELSKIKRLKTMEINHHRNIKLTFKDRDDDLIHNDDQKMKVITDDVKGPKVQNGAANGDNASPTNGGSAHQCGHGGGGDSSCNSYVKTNVSHCCKQNEFTCAGPSCFGNRSVEGAMKRAPNYVPIVQPAVASYGHPFAPPPTHYVPRGLPPANYSNADMNCDDALNTCSVM